LLSEEKKKQQNANMKGSSRPESDIALDDITENYEEKSVLGLVF
jgi:hypothetical protein